MASPQHTFEQLPIRIQRILFASNLTESSAMALPYAAAFARRFGAEILAVHVIAPEEYANIAPEQRGAMLKEMKVAEAERIHALLEAAGFTDIPFRIRIEHGEVLAAISAFAAAERVDLIVAGSHGRHGIRKLLSPAIDEEIAREASIPVLLIGPKVLVTPQAEARIHRILHPTDFEPQSRAALEYAYALARAYSAGLTVLHVAENIWREPLSTRMTAEAFCRMRMLESGLPEHEAGVEVTFQVEFGARESLIVEAAQNRDVQLIVMGVPADSHPELQGHLPGPLAYDVASHAPCPVLAVRGAAA